MTTPLNPAQGQPSQTKDGSTAEAHLHDLKEVAKDTVQDAKQEGAAHFEHYRDTAADHWAPLPRAPRRRPTNWKIRTPWAWRTMSATWPGA